MHFTDTDSDTDSDTDPAGDTTAHQAVDGAGDAAGVADYRGAACHARGIRPTVQVTVEALTLLGRNEHPATLEGYGPIDPDTARTLTAHAPSFTRILTHPETGVILSIGQDRYAVPADLRRALAHRDGSCRFPGCNRNPNGCDIDHALDWQYGGPTDHDNLAHLCRKHHNLKHHTGWRYRHSTGGTLTWTGPSGRTYTTHPDNNITPTTPPPASTQLAGTRPATVQPPDTHRDDPPPF